MEIYVNKIYFRLASLVYLYRYSLKLNKYFNKLYNMQNKYITDLRKICICIHQIYTDQMVLIYPLSDDVILQ